MGLLENFDLGGATRGLLNFIAMTNPQIREERAQAEERKRQAERQRMADEMARQQFDMRRSEFERQRNDDGLLMQALQRPGALLPEAEGALPADGVGPGAPVPNQPIDPQWFARQGGSVDGLVRALELNNTINPKPKQLPPMSLSPGGAIWDPNSGREVYRVPFKPEPERKSPQIQVLEEIYGAGTPQFENAKRQLGVKMTGGDTPAPRRATGPAPTPTASPPEATADKQQLAVRLGVPVAEVDPLAVYKTPSGRDTQARMLYNEATKRLNEAEEDASKNRNIAGRMQRFLELQGRVNMQGPVLGLAPALSSDAQEMDAIRDEITPMMRQPGSGATSDFDAKMFRNATVGRTKNEPANAAIAQAVILQARNTQDRVQFMRDYLTVNGHLDGADRQWRRYLEANPIFDPKAGGEMPKLNENRVPYQQFFAGAQPQQKQRKIKRTGTLNGRKVVEYEDGSVDYAD